MKKRNAPLAIAALIAAATPAHAAFTGDYSADHWTTTISGKGTGSAAMASDGSALTLVSSDIPGLEETGAYLWYSIVMSQDATLSFDWSYSTADRDGSTWDPFGYALGNTFTQLSADGSKTAQSGTVTLVAHAGDVFRFEQDSVDSLWGPATTSVSNFQAVSPVPEPAPFTLMLAGVLGLMGLASRRHRA